MSGIQKTMTSDDQQENIIIRDWFTFTSKNHDPMEIIDILGMSDVTWNQLDRGGYGYRSRIQFGHIKIYYDGAENMGVCCDMSGQGCREFEEYSKLPNKWDDLLAFISANDCNVTRLDVAFDDHAGIFDLKIIESDLRNYNFVSRFHNDPRIMLQLRGEGVDPGLTVYFGSPNSKVLFRIYDKAVERGYTDGTHWVRFEIQLRDDRAKNFLNLTKVDDNGNKVPMSAGEAFCGVVKNYLRLVVPSADTNKRRWEMTDYWKNFLGNVAAVSIYTDKGTDYNVSKCQENVQNRWGNAIAAMLEVCGSPENFAAMIADRKCAPNPKYRIMLNEYYAEQSRLNEIAANVALQLGLDKEEQEYIEAEQTGKREDFLGMSGMEMWGELV